jgi:Papain family cysteine protease
MPIRMVNDDPNQDPREDDNFENEPQPRNREAGGGMGGILMFLPFIFGIFKKSPKLMLFILVVGGFMYFKGCSMLSMAGGGEANSDGLPGRGADFDRNEYDKAEVYEPLDSDPSKTPLPEAVSLARFAPRALNQGQQGSCVGWGSAYAARTIIEAQATGQDPNAVCFSPAFLYNQIGLRGCQGSYINRAMEAMSQKGNLPFREFPYDDNDCGRQPDYNQLSKAASYKIRGHTRLTEDGGDYAVNFNGIKQHLAAGAPVVFGMTVSRSFMSDMMGQKFWRASQSDYAGVNSMGGHCMCLIGYDDNFNNGQGAFQIYNSWGPEWGENGIGWVSYKDFMNFTQEAYGVHPLPKQDGSQNTLACQVGLVENTSKTYIPLSLVGGNLFKTARPIAKGTKFKMEVKNSSECYIYIFGQETDNSSYVLFPYTKKHSAFCAITGFRKFPRRESLQADAVGNKDFMAIVMTKQPIDFNVYNQRINGSRQPTYQGKVNEAFAQMNLQNVRFGGQAGTIQFQTQAAQNQAVAMIVEIDKQ